MNRSRAASANLKSSKKVASLLILKKNSLVNNTFSAPGAEGCGSQILFGIFTGLIDDAVNTELGTAVGIGQQHGDPQWHLENAIGCRNVASEK